MKLKRAYMSGRALVVAIPKEWAHALTILPGTVLCCTLKDQAIHFSRALVTPQSLHQADSSPVAPQPVREKGPA